MWPGPVSGPVTQVVLITAEREALDAAQKTEVSRYGNRPSTEAVCFGGGVICVMEH